MRLLDSLLSFNPANPRPPTAVRLTGPRVHLRMGMPSDWPAWQGLRGLSRDFLRPWEPSWPPDALSRGYFDGMLIRAYREWRKGIAYGFLIFARANSPSPLEGEGLGWGMQKEANPPSAKSKDLLRKSKISLLPPQRRKGDILIGGIGLNDVRRGIGQKATLGYWIGEPYARQGYMTEAAGLVCAFGFRALKLHRIEASCLPGNEPSKKLLRRLGFDEEGYAKSYLRIDGTWQDHLLWGKIAPQE